MNWNFYQIPNTIGRTIVNVVIGKYGDTIDFHLSDGAVIKMFHEQDCCEEVAIDQIDGDPGILHGGTIVKFEEATKESYIDDPYGRTRYTFYNIRTTKGDLHLRWFGQDNRYYSVSVTTIIQEPTVNIKENS